MINGNTPLPGFHTDQQIGKAVISMNLVSDIQAHIHEFCTTWVPNGTRMVPLPTAPYVVKYPLPYILNTNPSTDL